VCTSVQVDRVEDDLDYVLAEASSFLRQYQMEGGKHAPDSQRGGQVSAEIERTGTYVHTRDELSFGAKVAWRNTARCVGKFYWKGLSVSDMRHLQTLDEIAEALIEHIRTATNGGRIRLLLTAFRPTRPGDPGPRIWNSQLVRYAGFRQPDGSVIGDRESVDFTETVLKLGWAGATGTPFDVLPLVLQFPGSPPRLFDIPSDAVLEVPLSHPDYPWFADLGLRWYAFPSISNQRLEIGGISYPAAPFSGWYTGAEVGARNLSETNRYNMLRPVAEKMGLDTRSDRTMWKDRAMLELTAAVLHSFTEAGVSIIDHHFASRQFVAHEKREQSHGRSTAAHWNLMIPPISGPATPVWERHYDSTESRPNFFPQPTPTQEITPNPPAA
jgi:nitric-oxide synthase